MAERIEETIALSNKRGLHARASSKLARLAGELRADVTISKGGETVPATSIMGLMMLGAACGDTVTVAAEGEAASEAVETIIALIADKFTENE